MNQELEAALKRADAFEGFYRRSHGDLCADAHLLAAEVRRLRDIIDPLCKEEDCSPEFLPIWTAKLKADSAFYVAEIGIFKEKCERLKADLAAAQEDSKRLDWLEKNGDIAAKYKNQPPASDHTGPLFWKINYIGNESTETLRAAIDSARKEQT